MSYDDTHRGKLTLDVNTGKRTVKKTYEAVKLGGSGSGGSCSTQESDCRIMGATTHSKSPESIGNEWRGDDPEGLVYGDLRRQFSCEIGVGKNLYGGDVDDSGSNPDDCDGIGLAGCDGVLAEGDDQWRRFDQGICVDAATGSHSNQSDCEADGGTWSEHLEDLGEHAEIDSVWNRDNPGGFTKGASLMVIVNIEQIFNHPRFADGTGAEEFPSQDVSGLIIAYREMRFDSCGKLLGLSRILTVTYYGS